MFKQTTKRRSGTQTGERNRISKLQNSKKKNLAGRWGGSIIGKLIYSIEERVTTGKKRGLRSKRKRT